MSTKGFAASVGAWTKKAKTLPDEAFQEFLRLVYQELMRAMPEVTGNLKRSVLVTDTGLVPVDTDPAKQYVDMTAENMATIANMKIGEKAYISVTAPYAIKENYGGDGESGKFFIEITASKFKALQAQAIRNVKARS
ncbi:hypothetical protein [Salipiger mangrovisoli]|uniref:HK97 gp10 family phage protein n=1 Tax=Salipiger mangrovisoli TaxID=2865933 RepID=A0ABR9WZ24_9RHOB|nr:hypothetical protein [Salipiger mangrovisoli]MBE9636544.1 hypothetical protein [Salipiger mangrovisoli]